MQWERRIGYKVKRGSRVRGVFEVPVGQGLEGYIQMCFLVITNYL